MKKQRFVRSAVALACASFFLPMSAAWAGTGTACQASVSSILFSEDFTTTLDPAKWTVNSTGGSVVSGGGKITVIGNTNSPFIQAVGNPIPSTGDFSLYCKAKYLSYAGFGNGACVASEKLGNGTHIALWGDTSNTGSHPKLTFGISGWTTTGDIYTITTDNQVHEYETCFIGSTVTMYRDGIQVATGQLPATWNRPKYLWLGHPQPNPSGNNWSSFETNKIEVRALGGTPTAPTCTLTPTPSTITAGQSATLTATCTPAATSYQWSDTACASTSATCTVTPNITTSYTVKGSNSGGVGGGAGGIVTVYKTPELTIDSPEGFVAGKTITLKSNLLQLGIKYQLCLGTSSKNYNLSCHDVPIPFSFPVVGKMIMI